MKMALIKGTVFLMAVLLLAALACGPSAPLETPVQNPATQEPAPLPATPARKPATHEPGLQPETPVRIPAAGEPAGKTETPAPSQPEMVEAPAPIDGVEIEMSQDDPPRYALNIDSGLPGGCVQFGSYAVSQDGNSINVTVTNLEPASPKPCTTIYGQHRGQVDLGSGFTPGETYTVAVNGETTNSFTARDPQGDKMAQAKSPIERTLVEASKVEPFGYMLRVISRLPLGSSCSIFNGYDISHPAAGVINVTVTHLEVTGLKECTADLPVVTTDIPLGADFISGEAYRVVVNGEMANSFTARGTEDRTWAVKRSPIRGSEIIILEIFPPQYRLNVISSLPRGSSCSRFNGYDVARPSANLIVLTVTHLEVTEDNVPCTRDLPVVETVVSLGSGFNSGEEYTVEINGQVTEKFKAQ